jgi:hypothetical protein
MWNGENLLDKMCPIARKRQNQSTHGSTTGTLSVSHELLSRQSIISENKKSKDPNNNKEHFHHHDDQVSLCTSAEGIGPSNILKIECSLPTMMVDIFSNLATHSW